MLIQNTFDANVHNVQVPVLSLPVVFIVLFPCHIKSFFRPPSLLTLPSPSNAPSRIIVSPASFHHPTTDLRISSIKTANKHLNSSSKPNPPDKPLRIPPRHSSDYNILPVVHTLHKVVHTFPAAAAVDNPSADLAHNILLVAVHMVLHHSPVVAHSPAGILHIEVVVGVDSRIGDMVVVVGKKS